jgi:hypothetical protein
VSDQAPGCGRFARVLAAIVALGAGALVALFFLPVSLPVAIALGVVLTLATMAAVVVAVLVMGVRFGLAASRRSKTTGPYQKKLDEIDGLEKDVEAAFLRVAGSDFAASDLGSRMRELRARRDSVLHALIEIDEFLRQPSNKDYRIRTESTYVRMRERLAGESVKPELSENAARLKDVQDAIGKVKADRQALIANLDRIAIGLREIRARMLPTAAALASGEEIARDLGKLTEAITTEERIRKELDALETPDGGGPRPPPQKLPH